MRVNEVEELLQISRANIRYYEKEGLLHPKRSSNGYRCYSDEDVAVLKEIIIFRKLGLSLAQIRDVQEGKVSVSEALSSNIQHLQEQIFELNGAVELCKCICADQRADTDFDREKYWTMLLAGEKKGFRFMDMVNDYVSFEKRTLKSLGISGCAALFFICAGRGFFSEIFLGQGFVFGFFYPFILFLIISALMFPIFLLSAKYKDVEIKEEPGRKRRGIGWTLLKCAVLFGGSISGSCFYLWELVYLCDGGGSLGTSFYLGKRIYLGGCGVLYIAARVRRSAEVYGSDERRHFCGMSWGSGEYGRF